MLEGFDCSQWQGDIDWDLVALARKNFVIVRGGDGFYRDPYLKQNVIGALNTGMYVHVYHYLRFALSPADMVAECHRTYQEARNAGLKPEAILWLDLEDTSIAKLMTPTQRVDWLREVIALLDMPLGIYTGWGWWVGQMANSIAFKYLPLWTAGYPLSYQEMADSSGVDGYSPWLYADGWQWDIWQFTSSGQMPGIVGRVDLNVAREGVFKGDDMGLDETMYWEGQPMKVKVLNALFQEEVREVSFRQYIILEAQGLIIKECRCKPVETTHHIHGLVGTAE